MKSLRFQLSALSFIALFFALCSMLSAPCYAGDVTLAWDPNSEPDLAGYRLYQAEIADGVSTNWEMVAEIPAGTEIYTVTIDGRKNYAWQLTAYDTEGNESFVSNMAELVRQQDRTPPGRTKNLKRR